MLSRGWESDNINLKMLLPGFNTPDIATLDAVYGKAQTPNSICWTINKRLAHATTVRAGSEEHDYTQDVLILRAFIDEILAAVEQVRPR